jgi:hypothetical protein
MFSDVKLSRFTHVSELSLSQIPSFEMVHFILDVPLDSCVLQYAFPLQVSKHMQVRQR